MITVAAVDLKYEYCNISPAFPRECGMGASAAAAARRSLVVFDFDQTLTDADTYTTVGQMAPLRGKALPVHLQHPPKLEGWPEYMKEILQFNKDNNITAAEIRQKLESLPMVPGMADLLSYLRENRSILYDTVILSDANMCFIQWVLQRHNLTDCFTKIFSNPAEIDATGNLVIGNYHYQTECELSPKNMCKAKILHDWMVEQEKHTGQPYKAIYYVGDGENDLCPGKRLTANDIFFVRKDFPLAKKLIDSHVSCKIELWSDGNEVLNRLKELS